MFKLTARDLERLKGVHPDLVKVVMGAIDICSEDFMVVEGLRTLEKQKEYFAAGKSTTMRSRHLTGHAVDLAPLVDLDGDGSLELSWKPFQFYPVSQAMKLSAKSLKIPIEWGGDWHSFHDMPHFQLPWKDYP